MVVFSAASAHVRARLAFHKPLDLRHCDCDQKNGRCAPPIDLCLRLDNHVGQNGPRLGSSTTRRIPLYSSENNTLSYGTGKRERTWKERVWDGTDPNRATTVSEGGFRDSLLFKQKPFNDNITNVSDPKHVVMINTPCTCFLTSSQPS